MTSIETLSWSRRQLLQRVGGTLLAGGLMGSLAACGDSSGSGSATAVSLWFNRPENRQWMEDTVAAFTEAHPDIAVDVAYKPAGQYETVLKTALVGGAGPALMATAGAAGIWGDLGAEGGYIVPIDGELELDALLPSVREAITYEGHVYGAPVQTFRTGIYYQRPIFDEHGLMPPQTWEDLVSISRTLADSGVTAWSMPAQDMILPFFFYHLAVSSILGEASGTALASGQRKLTDPELVRAAQLMVDLSEYYNSGFESVAYAEGKSLFAQGRAAMTIGGSSDYAGYVEVNPDLDAGFVGFPSPDGSQPATALSGLSMALTVNKNAANPEAAKTFAAWMASEEAQRLVVEKLGLPSIKGIKPGADDARGEILGSMLEIPDAPLWLDFPPTGAIFGAVQQKGGPVFTGEMSAQEFAGLAQSAIVTAS